MVALLLLGVAVVEPDCCFVEVQWLQAVGVLLNLIPELCSVAVLEVVKALGVEMVWPLGDVKAEQGSTTFVFWYRWVFHNLYAYFGDNTALFLQLAREYLQMAKRASKRVIAIACPLSHTFEVKLRHYAPIELVGCLEKAVHRCNWNSKFLLTILDAVDFWSLVFVIDVNIDI